MAKEYENYDEIELNLEFLHEIRTDLSVIGGYASFLLDSRGSLSEEQVESIDAIKKSYQKVNGLTNAFIDFIRLNRDIWKLFKEDINLAEIIKNETEAVRHIFEGEKIEFVFNLPAEKTEIKGNIEAISHTVQYLLMASIKFAQVEDVKIFIALSKEDNEWKCIIQNNGSTGIPINETANIFKPFYQSPALFGGKKESGFGLIVARKILHLHKGNLAIQSEPGQGIKIIFSIPAKASKAPKKILIVEDNLIIAKMWTRLLKDEFTILISTSGKDALDKVKRESFDLIILDILMPEMDGFEIYNKLKANKKTASIPIFILSNLVQKDLGEKIKSMDIAGYFVKANLSPALLKDKIKKIFEEKKTEEEE